MPSRAVAAWVSFSTMISFAPESSMIHRIWSALELSYTGTVTAPTAQMAKSIRFHS